MRALFLLLILTGCWKVDCDDPSPLILPDTPVNLQKMNSPFDDWNCGAPWETWESGKGFLFSTNRKTSGGTFDINPTSVHFDNENGFAADTAAPPYGIQGIADRINTAEDELGPTFVFETTQDEGRRDAKSLVFSRGGDGKHDLIALSPDNPMDAYASLWWHPESLVEVALSPLNTPADEGYATWSRESGTFYFHSNRDGRYGIYQAAIPLPEGGIAAWLRHPDTAGVRISKVPGFASDGQERCPFLHGNALYFISDRTGGQGGFDLYRSYRNGNSWTAPENLGPRINSASNEYRPLAFTVSPTEAGLFFSSDRPGGKGGYDLYAVSLIPRPQPR